MRPFDRGHPIYGVAVHVGSINAIRPTALDSFTTQPSGLTRCQYTTLLISNYTKTRFVRWTKTERRQEVKLGAVV